MENVDAVIFDLGGVLLNLDYNRTAEAFKALGMTDFDLVYSQLKQTDLFDRFETGAISGFHFVNRLLDQLPMGTNANQVVHAWNAMILNFPKERMNWLREFSKENRIFLLSNTNSLHLEKVKRALKETTGSDDLESYFEKAYYSHELKMRKPNPEIFLKVCENHGLNPDRTLFIDDTLQHIAGAKAVGLQTIHLEPGMEIQSVLS